jgi:histone H3/H4
MNAVRIEFAESVAESLGITATKEALRSLASDVDYKLREIVEVRKQIAVRGYAASQGLTCVIFLIQHAKKIARKSRRSTINADDINNAFRNLNIEVRGLDGVVTRDVYDRNWWNIAASVWAFKYVRPIPICEISGSCAGSSRRGSDHSFGCCIGEGTASSSMGGWGANSLVVHSWGAAKYT